jgi:4-hydroxy-tetrahydrodipicolinate synthase
MQWSGAYTALVTPFFDDGRLDYKSLAAIIDDQIARKIAGLVVCGSTGESPTLTSTEHVELVKFAVRQAAGRVPVVAGTGSNSTQEAIELSRHAQQCGADALMIVMPYYNRPNQAGLADYCLRIASSVGDLPIVLYNIPSRTGCDLQTETLEIICDAAKNVEAIKDATGSITRPQEICRRLGNRLSVLCGDDALTVAAMAVGAKGVVSVTSNLFPREVQSVCDCMTAGDIASALLRHQRLLPVHDSMFLETNPTPIKFAMSHRGYMQPRVRSPLVTPSVETQNKIAESIEAYVTCAGSAS